LWSVLNFGVRLPEDDVNEVSTYSSDLRLYRVIQEESALLWEMIV
jgi:hypothetical protein